MLHSTARTCCPSGRPAGLPPSTADFYCNATRKACFSKGAATATFPAARSTCTAAGGDLVALTSYEKQAEIEKALVPLTSYWIGIQKVGCTASVRLRHGLHCGDR